MRRRAAGLAAVALAAALPAMAATGAAARPAAPEHPEAGTPRAHGAAAARRLDRPKRRRGPRTHVRRARETPRWSATGFAPAPTASGAPTPAAPNAPAAPGPAPTATPAPSGPTLPELPAADPRSVSVGATEFAFTLSQPSVGAGDVRIQFDNRRGEDPHDLLVVRGGAVVAHFGALAAGDLTARTVALRGGSYDLWCPLEGHVSAGMSATLTVRSGP